MSDQIGTLFITKYFTRQPREIANNSDKIPSNINAYKLYNNNPIQLKFGL